MNQNTHSAQNGQSTKHIPISGSDRTSVAGARKVGPSNPSERISVTVLLRRQSPDKLEQLVHELAALAPEKRQHLSHDEFVANHGAHQQDIEAVEAFAKAHGFDVKEVNVAGRTVVLTGEAKALADAFGIELSSYEHADFTYRGRTGPIHVPSDLQGIVTGVFGLDNRPQSKPHFRIHREERANIRALATDVSYTPPQVAQLYNFPTGVDCSDQCIGIIELGGGYNETSIQQYFTQLGVPQPTVTSVSVDGATNKPTGNADGPDGEVDLDIEVAGSVAPGVRIAVYFAPNTDAGFLNAITTAIHDTTNKPSVISISWGGPESTWTNQAMQAMNSAFQDAAALGITVCCAAGDGGSTDGVNDGQVHVDFPASAPYALACGGTRLNGSGSSITSETVWNDGANGGATGGGVSSVFALPSWQANANVPPSANGGQTGRGVPDVAGDADPATGYQVSVDGQTMAIGGTSAVAPLWAALIALANHTLGRKVGYANPLLYGIAPSAGAFHDITQGNNDTTGTGGAYRAGPGWDACTGLGSPDGVKLINALQTQPGASC